MVRITKRKGTNRAARMKRRLDKSVDQIREEMEKQANQPRAPTVDLELPGLGRFQCAECDRHFVNAKTLEGHLGTKGHKRRVKQLNGTPYSHTDAERGAGMGLPDNGLTMR
eukprot:Plantae.Rhodophyta-Rhodochaete_pulchella.ctg7957.p2 GENE.Plantae.Rhodophyta-Rhodochaete_pulchella.ctg7957~~Plantae.Rhodophyta-Rhodochaete_pulchella.ctg7957.p2  ORF type:complete len:111 (+),score=16.26 Plantae.Rhodophyta-Rhodochaete_pulchella.ctg7957:828-1160(+)